MTDRDSSAATLASTLTPHATGGLHRTLSSFGVLLLTLSCLSPVVSIYGVGSDVLQHAGTGSVGLFLLGLAAALVWAAIYAELGSAYPYSGGDYVGVGSILGSWAGAATLVIWAVTAGPSVAFGIKIVASYAGELAPSVSPQVITFGSLALAICISLLAVRTGAWITGLFLAVEMIAVMILFGCGFIHPARGLEVAMSHPMTVSPGGAMVPASLAVLALAAVSAVYGTVGGNQAIAFGEELGDPHRRMGPVIVVACMVGAVCTALPVVAVVLGARDLPAVLKSAAPLATFVQQIAGPGVAKALSAGVALAVFNAGIAGIMANSRLFFSMARDGLFPGPLNRLLMGVNPRSGTPRAATLVVGVFSAGCCLLSSHTLLIFLSGLLVYGWSLVCLSVLVGRRKGLTGGPGYWKAPLYPLAPILGLLMAAAFTIADLFDADSGRPSVILLGGFVLAAVLWSQFVLQRRPGGWTPSLGDIQVQPAE